MLKIEDLEVSYGAVQALRGISMEVNDGEIVSLIGANGAGKTTTLHAITGLVPIRSGSVIYDGHDLRKTDPSRIVTMGLAHVPEGRQVFTRMTVAENLILGAETGTAFKVDRKEAVRITTELSDKYNLKVEAKEKVEDISLAMQAGWSTAPDDVRSLGFGAGMGLPNMKKYTDEMKIESTVGVGTTVSMTVFTHPQEEAMS